MAQPAKKARVTYIPIKILKIVLRNREVFKGLNIFVFSSGYNCLIKIPFR